MIDRLFVYGTLAPGRSNAHVLAGIDGTWEPATVIGTLHPEGWGAAAGYPGLVPDANGDEVAGFLLTSTSLQDHWGRIDQFEGEGYERTLARVKRADGELIDAFVYTLSAKGLPAEAR